MDRPGPRPGARRRGLSGAPGGPALTPVLDVAGLRLDRPGFRLTLPHLTLAPGQVLALAGPSGSGKSTCLDLLALVLAPTAAERLDIAGTDAVALWQHHALDALARLRGRRIGYVLQTGGLVPFLSVADNIALPCRLTGQDPGRLVADLARRLGLSRHLDRRPDRLSVGERQRVAVARALVHRPALVLADEPTAALDPVNAGRVMDLLLDLVADAGVAAVIASHDWADLERRGLTIARPRLDAEGDGTKAVLEVPS